MREVPLHERAVWLWDCGVVERSLHGGDPRVALGKADRVRRVAHAQARVSLAFAISLRPAEILDQELRLIPNGLFQISWKDRAQQRIAFDPSIKRACDPPKRIGAESSVERVRMQSFVRSTVGRFDAHALILEVLLHIALAILMTLHTPLPGAQVPPSLLRPLPSSGAVPMAVDPAILQAHDGSDGQSYERAAKDFIRTRFGARRGLIRTTNLEQFSQWTVPASWQALWDAMQEQRDDVKIAFFDHLAAQGDLGEAMLAKIAIKANNTAIRHEATRRIRRPACDAVVAVIDLGLRDKRHVVANQAGLLAGKVDAFAVIPALIFAQATADEKKNDGDLAWIAIGSQISYVANVQAVVGDGAAAFTPVIGNLQTGVLMRVQDAMVYNYRSDVHQSLITLTTRDFGASTADMGWDIKRWWQWFNEVYVPFKQARAATDAAPAAPPAMPPRADSTATASNK